MTPLVETLTEDHRWEALGLEALAETAARAALRVAGVEPAGFEVSCLGCSDARIAALNEDFRHKPQPTNVLSWPSAERGAARAGDRPRRPHAQGPGPTLLGDVAIAYETCAAEAEAAHRPLADHATHLLVHATLHLLGFDHEREADALLMERLETEAMAGLGLPDPYADPAMSFPPDDGDHGSRPDAGPSEPGATPT
jgi:probable rRNA maturation factor